MGLEDMKIIGTRIKKERKKKNLSQYELSNLTNLSNVFISNVENGKCSISLDAFITIANALDVSCDYLLNGIQKNTTLNPTLLEEKILLLFEDSIKMLLSNYFKNNSITKDSFFK